MGTPRTTDTTAIGNQLRPELGRWVNIRKIKHQQSPAIAIQVSFFFVYKEIDIHTIKEIQ